MSGDNPIDTLLDAERQAERDVRQCKTDARETINRALKDARRIRERADRRISAIHARCAEGVKVETQRLWNTYQDEPQTPIDNKLTEQNIQSVAKRMAARLTGDENDGDDDG